MSTILEQLLFDPARYLSAFDGDHVAFRAMDRESYARSIFLDDRIVATDDITTRVPIGPLLAGVKQVGRAAQPLNFIFHVAHCGSTLLANALERPGRDLVLREPMALRQLGVLAANEPGPPPREWATIAHLACHLLAKRFQGDAAVIVKANVPVNFMVPWLLQRQPATRAIFLYMPFEAYLQAVLRTEDHRGWVLQVCGDLFPALDGIADMMDLLDAPRMAAVLWLVQMRIFAAALERYPGTRSLDAAVLFARPAEVVAASFALFGVPTSAAEVDATVAGPVFSSYAKNPQLRYDEAERRRQQDKAAARLKDDIAGARAWLEQKLADFPLPDALPRPLVGEERPLL